MMEPFITFHPIGRTGNLMFQCAACIGTAKTHGVKWGVPSDTREVPHFHQMFKNLPRADGSYRRYQEHPNAHCEKHGMHYDQCHFNYHPIPAQSSPTKLVGFFQSWKYFEHAEDEVKAAFKLDRHNEYNDKVSIHVRRGDYVQHSGSFPPVDMAYLIQAMSHFPNRKFVVFSDDLDWCRINLGSPDNIEYCDERNEFRALSYMASCSDHIIANSTFSYWGAYLGWNQKRKVITPSCERGQWFGWESGVRQDCVDLLPPSWTQIKWR